MARIIIVNEDSKTLNILSTLLKTEGYRVVPVLGLTKSVGFVKSQQFDLMIFDVATDPAAGVDVVQKARDSRPEGTILAITDDAAEEAAEAISGMDKCVLMKKPFKPAEFLAKVYSVIESGGDTPSEDKKTLATTFKLVEGSDEMVAKSEAMQAVREMIKRVAPTDIIILVTGERGTDKDLVGRAVHLGSPRKDSKLVAVDCRELNESELADSLWGGTSGCAFREAAGGTLFIDNIDAMPGAIQEKLASALESKTYVPDGGAPNANPVPLDVRLVVGAAASLGKLVERGEFNEKLYKYVNMMPIAVKPLRDRREDIMPLAEKILREKLGDACPVNAFKDDVISVFENYQWPGNVQELASVLDAMIANSSGGEFSKADVPQEVVCAGEAAKAHRK